MKDKIKLSIDVAQEVGIPGAGLLGRFAQNFYDKHLQKRFAEFCNSADIGEEFINDISENEDYSNYLYACLETVRQTHSKLGVQSLALIYKNHNKDPDFLIPATRAFSQISDNTLISFIDLYEEIKDEKPYLELSTLNDGEQLFHQKYNEAVELIHRNFFIQSTSASMMANGPIQGMKWIHTDKYYEYVIKAKELNTEIMESRTVVSQFKATPLDNLP